MFDNKYFVCYNWPTIVIILENKALNIVDINIFHKIKSIIEDREISLSPENLLEYVSSQDWSSPDTKCTIDICESGDKYTRGYSASLVLINRGSIKPILETECREGMLEVLNTLYMRLYDNEYPLYSDSDYSMIRNTLHKGRGRVLRLTMSDEENGEFSAAIIDRDGDVIIHTDNSKLSMQDLANISSETGSASFINSSIHSAITSLEYTLNKYNAQDCGQEQ